MTDDSWRQWRLWSDAALEVALTLFLLVITAAALWLLLTGQFGA